LATVCSLPLAAERLAYSRVVFVSTEDAVDLASRKPAIVQILGHTGFSDRLPVLPRVDALAGDGVAPGTASVKERESGLMVVVSRVSQTTFVTRSRKVWRGGRDLQRWGHRIFERQRSRSSTIPISR